MSGQLKPLNLEASTTVKALRERLGLFSFHPGERQCEPQHRNGSMLEIDVRPGEIVEWFVARPGSGALTSSLWILSRRLDGRGAWAIVDAVGDFYIPALSGWGINLSRTLLLRPGTVQDTCWVIEQCLRCPGVSVTLAIIDKRLPTSVQRRWKMAAEAGGGVGLLFRPDGVEREPVWADLRLRVTPLSGGQGDARLLKIEVLYRRGGLGGSAQVWEIDHAEGDVHLVSELANPTAAERAVRA